MDNFIQKFHSGWAYLALLLLVFAVANSFIGMSSKKEFTAKDRKIALFALIGTHLQLLIGLILYFVSEVGFKQLSGAAMKNSELKPVRPKRIRLMRPARRLLSPRVKTACCSSIR